MHKLALKAVFAVLTINKAGRKRPDWDRIVLITSAAVTAGLVALYVYGKTTARW
jgi:hypothetical protein